MTSQSRRQESGTLTVRGIWTVGNGGEELTTSARAEKKHKGHTRPNSLSTGNKREGKLAGEIGKKSWSQPREDLEHKAQPRADREHLS